jgi:hypothetical protein
MRVLVLGAVDLEEGFGIIEQRFGHGFDQPGLAGTGGPEQEHDADGTVGRVETGHECLDKLGGLDDRFVLPDHFLGELLFEVRSICVE